jgi:kynurenine formamidase
VVGNTVRDFYGGVNKHTVGTDDVIMMPTHGATHWDALAHITFEGRIWNGYSATEVGNRGALKNDISKVRDRFVGRGVLLDMPRFLGVDWLEPGTPISGEELDACAVREGVELRRGDFVLIRTGQLAQVRAQGTWGSYAGGPAPGLGLDAVPWMYKREMAAVATDTWGVEVIPNETADVFQPLHILMIPIMGLTMGEMFNIEDLATDCAADGIYEFFFCAPPLPITGGVGSPVNPIVVK